MKKIRILFVLSLVFAFFTVFIHPSFAAEDMQEGDNPLGRAAEGTSNVVRSGAEAITGTGRAIGNAVQYTAQGARNMVEGSTHKVESEARSATDNNRNDGYTATQTSTRAAAEPTVFGMNATMWTWMIVILTAIGIGSLIWFYNSAKADIHRSNH